MSTEEDIISLIVQCHDLATTELGPRREKRSKKMSGEETKRGPEIINDEFRGVRGGIAMARHLFSFNPIGDGEVEGWPTGEMNNRKSAGTLLIFIQNKESGVATVSSERGDLPDGEFMAIAVRGAANVVGIREEGGQ